MISTLSAALVLCAAPVSLPQEPAVEVPVHDGIQWVTNFEQAKAQAKAQKKDLFVDFTGSDWCGWCIKLNEEVFQHAEFFEKAAEKFVFVELDYPQQKEQSEELKKQNAELQERFGIQGFPTILLLDADAKPYAQTGYQAGGPAKYLEHVGEFVAKREARDAAVSKAMTAKGIDRAQCLAEALDALDPNLHPHYLAWVDEIIQLDADGKASLKDRFEGIKKKLAVEKALSTLQSSLNGYAEADKWLDGAAAIEKVLTEHKGSLETAKLQEFTYYHAVFLHRGGEKQKAVKVLEAAIAVDPESRPGKGLAGQLEEWKREIGGEPNEGSDETPVKKTGK